MTTLPPDDPRTLTQRASRGAAWAITGSGLRQVVGVVLSLVLMRLLSPDSYGLIGMVMAIVYIVNDVRDLRFADALIQRKQLSDGQRSSVFWLHVGVGSVLTAALVAGAPALAWFYGKPQLAPLAMALGLKPFLESLSDVSRILLTRRMAFKRIALAALASLVVSGAAATALAAAGYGAWALVCLNLLGSIVNSALLIVWAGWLPSLRLRWDRLRELRRFSLFLYGARVAGQFGRNVDKILVGRYLGAGALGLYGVGFRLMMKPLEQVAWQVNRVMFAALSEIQEDHERFRQAYLRGARMLAAVTFPLSIGLCVTAAEFIAAVGRQKWIGAVTATRILCATGCLESVLATAGWIFFAQSRTRREFRLTIASLIVTAGCIVAGLPYGIEGVAVAYMVRTVILTGPVMVLALRLIRLPFATVLRALAGPACAVAVMAGAVLGVREAMLRWTSFSTWSMLWIEVALGAVVYLACLRVTGPQVWKEAINLARPHAARLLRRR